MKSKRGAYRLTLGLVAEHGGSIVCIDERAIGQKFSLFSEKPAASLNEPIRADVVSYSGGALDISPTDATITRVDIRGPIGQRACEHECGGYSDGHDAIAERMISALETSDVLLVVDSPGGAHAGLQEAIKRVLAAKSEYGRRVIAYADEMIGSAAYWWVASVADEIYGPESMLVGSIGARAGHQSVARQLDREGVDTTYFVWPGNGKVAFAPEMPLSELGKQRGDRDVASAGVAFAEAVAAARGLTIDDIIRLDADVLPGELAVDAGLADGVASLDDVTCYALALAGGGDTMAKLKTEAPKTPDEARAEDDKEKEELEGESPDKTGDEAGEEGEPQDEGEEPEKSDEDDEPEEDEEEDEEEEEEPVREKKSKAKAKASAKATVASILGLHANASQPAVKSAAMAMSRLAGAVMSATGTSSASAALGALQGLVDDAAEVKSLRDKVSALKKSASARERTDLLLKLSAAGVPGYSRGDLFIDREENGKLVSAPSPVYSEMKLATLRGLVDSKIQSGSPRKSSSPFEPSKEKSEQAKASAEIESVKETPFIAEAASHSRASREDLARSAAALIAAGMMK